MFRTKICGVTSIDDALCTLDAGADALGLNFYPKSPRYVAPETAHRIAEVVRGRLLLVGVMVNPSVPEAVSLASQIGLDAVQLHGDEAAALATEISRSVAVIRAFRVSTQGLSPVFEYLEQSRKAGGEFRSVLFDAFRPGQFGGVGKTADWNAIEQYPSEDWHPPFILAGGLTPANVALAIQKLHPYGVDTASGVEVSPGRKSPALVVQFVRAAREAFAVS